MKLVSQKDQKDSELSEKMDDMTFERLRRNSAQVRLRFGSGGLEMFKFENHFALVLIQI